MCATGIVPALHDAPLCDRDGVRIGVVEDLLADATTNRPAWLVVRLRDGRRTVVPARGARPTRAGMRVRHPYDAVRTCPVTLAEPALGREHVVRVCRHYGVPVPPGTWADACVAVRASGPPASVPAAA
jgi:hypothetical protein